VRRRLEREGVSSGSCCRGRQRLQGKAAAATAAAAGEVEAVEGAGQGAKPSVAEGKAAAGGSRGQQLAAAATQWSLDVREGRETLDLWQRRLWRSNQETVVAGNPSPTLPCTVVS
jgi:hypothetical protein